MPMRLQLVYLGRLSFNLGIFGGLPPFGERIVDFRRFQIDLREQIKMDDVKKIPELVEYGKELGQKILNDETEPITVASIAQIS